MRPAKITREELLYRCANTFKRLGYNGTTMDTLATECGLTKASFYHHYPNKEALLRDVLSWTHERLSESLFALAYEPEKTASDRLAVMGKRASKLFLHDAIGCLMGVVAVDASYTNSSLMTLIRGFFDDWAKAFAQLLDGLLSPAEAQAKARQWVADYEGAILLARIYNQADYVEAVTRRALAELQAVSDLHADQTKPSP